MKKIYKSLSFLSIIITVANIFSCSSQQIKNLKVDEFEKQLIATKGEQLIDVRTLQEFEKYRIKSAKNIDYKSPDFRKEIEKFDKTKPVLIYCLSGARSKSAAETLLKAGFKNVYNLEGGINAWSKSGKSIDQDLSGKGELSSEDFTNIISAEGYVLVDFYAPWCAPCQKMLPIVEELAKSFSGKFKLLTVDFDQNRLLAKEQNIRSVPYLAVYKDGKKIWDKNEATGKEELMEILKLK
jgi:thioredoxin